MGKPFLIVSIDGGGVRGVFAAKIISYLYSHFKLQDQVNLLTGTSTGAIIAACLSIGVNPERIVNFYEHSSSTIFKRRLQFTPKLIEKALHSPYDNNRLKAILRQALGKAHLNAAKTPLLIPTTELKDGSSHIFASFEHNDDTLFMYDVVMASCSAPTFFDPTLLEGHLLADGGLYANNPGLIALSYAKEHFKVDLKDIKIISIGTGHFRNCYKAETVRWGLVNGWKVRTLTEFVASVQSQTTYETMQKLLGDDKLLRINFSHDELISPDEFTKIELLIDYAKEEFVKNKEKIKDFIEKI